MGRMTMGEHDWLMDEINREYRGRIALMKRVSNLEGRVGELEAQLYDLREAIERASINTVLVNREESVLEAADAAGVAM